MPQRALRIDTRETYIFIFPFLQSITAVGLIFYNKFLKVYLIHLRCFLIPHPYDILSYVTKRKFCLDVSSWGKINNQTGQKSIPVSK